jgi:hypothetical protein
VVILVKMRGRNEVFLNHGDRGMWDLQGRSREQSAGSSDRALFCDLFGRIATHESKIDL